MTPLSLLAVEFFNLEVDVIDYQYGAASEQAEEQVLYGNAARQTSAGTAPQYRLAAPKQDPAVSRSRRRPYRQ